MACHARHLHTLQIIKSIIIKMVNEFLTISFIWIISFIISFILTGKFCHIICGHTDRAPLIII